MSQMKRVILIVSLFILVLSSASAEYNPSSKEAFINSPSLEQIKQIEDPLLKYCELSFLKAYMRREFSDIENKYCSDFFEQKIEAHINYMKDSLSNRGIY